MFGLRSLSDDQLEERHEALRLKYLACQDIASADRLYNELSRYNAEITRRMNRAWDRENPNPPAPRHREHGWYLSKDD